jgi:hypothetical protein
MSGEYYTWDYMESTVTSDGSKPYIDYFNHDTLYFSRRRRRAAFDDRPMKPLPARALRKLAKEEADLLDSSDESSHVQANDKAMAVDEGSSSKSAKTS